MTDRDRLAQAVADADSVVALTGAGISAPSGVPTFRGEDGIWDRFEEGQFTWSRFQRDPAGFWADRLELQGAMYGDEPPKPNDAHRALARLGQSGSLEVVVTQNVDGLHHEALGERGPDGTAGPSEDAEPDAVPATTDGDGASRDEPGVVELHGNARRIACTDCGRRTAAEPITDRARDGELPPRCECGGVLKPDVVLFGERLPQAALQSAKQFARDCDVFVAIGSSLVVQPAASLPQLAADGGATLAVVNLDGTPLDDRADVVLREDVTEVLPDIASRVLDD